MIRPTRPTLAEVPLADLSFDLGCEFGIPHKTETFVRRYAYTSRLNPDPTASRDEVGGGPEEFNIWALKKARGQIEAYAKAALKDNGVRIPDARNPICFRPGGSLTATVVGFNAREVHTASGESAQEFTVFIDVSYR